MSAVPYEITSEKMVERIEMGERGKLEQLARIDQVNRAVEFIARLFEECPDEVERLKDMASDPMVLRSYFRDYIRRVTI